MNVDDQEFYELCQAYRHAPFMDPAEVVARFEALKDAVKDMIEEARSDTAESVYDHCARREGWA